MKKALPFYASLAVCFAAISLATYHCWGLLQTPEASQPPLMAEPPAIEFGMIEEDIVQGSTLVRNVSKKPLRILHILVSCSCSEATLKAGELMPGQAEKLSVVWDTRGRQDETSTFISVVYVTDKEKQQMLHIDLKGRVMPTE